MKRDEIYNFEDIIKKYEDGRIYLCVFPLNKKILVCFSNDDYVNRVAHDINPERVFSDLVERIEKLPDFYRERIEFCPEKIAKEWGWQSKDLNFIDYLDRVYRKIAFRNGNH